LLIEVAGLMLYNNNNVQIQYSLRTVCPSHKAAISPPLFDIFFYIFLSLSLSCIPLSLVLFFDIRFTFWYNSSLLLC
jgi:hypothetical protein